MKYILQHSNKAFILNLVEATARHRFQQGSVQHSQPDQGGKLTVQGGGSGRRGTGPTMRKREECTVNRRENKSAMTGISPKGTDLRENCSAVHCHGIGLEGL